MAQMTPLRRRLLDDMTVRNLSPATQQSYVYAVAKFSRFLVSPLISSAMRRSEPISPPRRPRYVLVPYKPGVLCLAFLLRHYPRAQRRCPSYREREGTKKLPVVLSVDEIVRFLQAVPGLRNRTALTTAYSAGLRVSEVAR